MKGIICYESFMLKKKFFICTLFFIFFASTIFITPLCMNLLVKNTSPKMFIYLEGKYDSKIVEMLKEKDINITKDVKQANLKAVFSNVNKKTIVEVRNEGKSNELSENTKNFFISTINKYKEILVRNSLKEIDDSIINPIDIKFIKNEDEGNKTKTDATVGYLYLFEVLSAISFIFLSLQTGVLQERILKSFYSIILSNVNPYKKILVMFLFRVVFAALLVYIFGTIGSTIWLKTSTIVINFLILFNICLILYLCLILSLYVPRISYFIAIVGALIIISVFPGWVLSDINLIKYFPLTSGLAAAKKLLFGDSDKIQIIISMGISLITYIIFTIMGGKLLHNENLFKAQAD